MGKARWVELRGDRIEINLRGLPSGCLSNRPANRFAQAIVLQDVEASATARRRLDDDRIDRPVLRVLDGP